MDDLTSVAGAGEKNGEDSVKRFLVLKMAVLFWVILERPQTTRWPSLAWLYAVLVHQKTEAREASVMGPATWTKSCK